MAQFKGNHWTSSFFFIWWVRSNLVKVSQSVTLCLLLLGVETQIRGDVTVLQPRPSAAVRALQYYGVRLVPLSALVDVSPNRIPTLLGALSSGVLIQNKNIPTLPEALSSGVRTSRYYTHDATGRFQL